MNRDLLNANEDKELILYEILARFGFSADVSERLSRDPVLQPGKQFFSDSHVLLVDRDYLIIQSRNGENNPVVEIDSVEALRRYFVVEEFETQKNMAFEKNPDILYVPKEKLTFPLQIRSWRPGDYFYPLGAKGRQKLSDFFTDHKIDRFTKEKIRLLCAGNQIIWIVGWRSDERFKVQKPGGIYLLKTM